MPMPNRDRFTADRLTAGYCEVVGQELFVAICREPRHRTRLPVVDG
jgi:hypothetical protein